MLAMTPIRWQQPRARLVGSSAVSVPIAWNYVLLDVPEGSRHELSEPRGRPAGTGWHAHHSRRAIGNGALFGEGFMHGTQNQFQFLPDQYSDFPFAVFAEDWGFVGCGRACSASTGFSCIWAIHVASQAKDRFGAALAVGVGAIIFWHASSTSAWPSGSCRSSA